MIVKADETCSCGAKIDLELDGTYAATSVRDFLTEWRKNHKHVAKKEYVPFTMPYQPHWTTPTTSTTAGNVWLYPTQSNTGSTGTTGPEDDDGDDGDEGVPAKAG